LSGIDGVVTYAAGKCEIPIGIGPLELGWQPDIIRSDGGDDCPGLFGQEMLQYLNVSIHWSYFDTGDALMVVPQEDQNMAWGIRLLATDSGHLLLRTDLFPEKKHQGYESEKRRLNTDATRLWYQRRAIHHVSPNHNEAYFEINHTAKHEKAVEMLALDHPAHCKTYLDRVNATAVGAVTPQAVVDDKEADVDAGAVGAVTPQATAKTKAEGPSNKVLDEVQRIEQRVTTLKEDIARLVAQKDLGSKDRDVTASLNSAVEDDDRRKLERCTQDERTITSTTSSNNSCKKVRFDPDDPKVSRVLGRTQEVQAIERPPGLENFDDEPQLTCSDCEAPGNEMTLVPCPQCSRLVCPKCVGKNLHCQRCTLQELPEEEEEGEEEVEVIGAAVAGNT